MFAASSPNPSRDGGTGRRTRLKIWRGSLLVWVRPPLPAPLLKIQNFPSFRPFTGICALFPHSPPTKTREHVYAIGVLPPIRVVLRWLAALLCDFERLREGWGEHTRKNMATSRSRKPWEWKANLSGCSSRFWELVRGGPAGSSKIRNVRRRDLQARGRAEASTQVSQSTEMGLNACSTEGLEGNQSCGCELL